MVGERQRQLYVSPATQHTNLCQTGGIRQAALPLGENVVGGSQDLLVLLYVLCRGVAAWLIGGHEIDEVHPSQSETIGSGLEGLIGGAGSGTAGDGADLAPPSVLSTWTEKARK